MKQSKIMMMKEIMEAMIFLGINTEDYSNLKAKYGSADGVRKYLEKLLGA